MNTPCISSDVYCRSKASHRNISVGLIAAFLWPNRRVVANELPSSRRLLKDEQEITVCIAAPSRGPLQMKISRNGCEVFIERLHLEAGETQSSPLLFLRVALLVGFQHLGIATRYLRT